MAKVGGEMLCPRARQSNSISFTASLPLTEWPFCFAEHAAPARRAERLSPRAAEPRDGAPVAPPLVELSHQIDTALFADVLYAQGKWV